jgi:hypothetical protein
VKKPSTPQASAASPHLSRVSARAPRHATPAADPLARDRSAAAQDGEIIDARFKIVGRKRRFLSLVWRGLVTIFWAALIGFMIPPAWLAFEYARDFFR